MKLHNVLVVIASAVLACGASARSEAQVFVGGGPGFAAAPGYVGAGLGVGAFSPYGYGYGSPWGGTYGSFYSSSYYGGTPFVGNLSGGGYGFSYPYGYYGRFRGGFSLPPIVIPAGTMYGPGVVQDFLGFDQQVATQSSYTVPQVNVNAGQAGGGFGVLAPGANVPKAHVHASNQPARDRAKKQLAIGDDWFRKQQYGNAASAYREAIRAAPDVADAYFHQAAIAVAQNRYDAAVDGIKSGMRISTAYLDAGFKYSTLYGDNKLARTAHLETLAQAATVEPTSDLYFLMGVMLFFDDHPRRAGPFFAKARELSAGETWHIDVFSEILRRMDAAAAEQAMAKGAQAGGNGANPQPIGAPPAANPPGPQPPQGAAPRAGADGREI